MPLNVRLSVPELTAIMNHSGARMVIFEPDFEATVHSLRPVCPGVEKWITTAAERTENSELTYEELLAAGTAKRLDIFAVDTVVDLTLHSFTRVTANARAKSLQQKRLHPIRNTCVQIIGLPS